MNSPGGHLVVGRRATFYGMANLNFFAVGMLSFVLYGCSGPEGGEAPFEPPRDTAAGADQSTDGSDWQAIVLQEFVCGDNCYLRYTTTGHSGLQEALCRAPECGEWERLGRLPDELRLRTAEAQFSTGVQVDGAGTVMREDFPSVVALRLGDQSVPEDGDDRLPLRRGLYVIAGTDCANPANAAFREWTGQGLQGSATRDCTLSVLARNGIVYSIRQSCVNTYDESRTATEFVLEIMDSSAFILQETDETSQFEWCEDANVPGRMK